ncbi:FxsA family protein [Mycolicibacterium brumae]|uniref:Membrane protein FxsA n=1 Tax=Mycolicibacterium brumae TaxID=85968 RepID=A0A2G5PBI2_9MYCO|nr:FxsA family protein [Mycolicibacterium brumae]MCV7192905.1 FxsA family protein [Mycolicibacterium brumae]PIB75254.1 membrane protein FxsA [Mycolicibacterium brumae]RWA23494.1 hypothetical protein MBRU_01335 [Mycolicibacterium brumae DSM 44177]UWW08576.1 FxsA family protein [Mycolicibacterium brumae]
MRHIGRFLGLYVLIELTAVVGLIWWLGFGPALLVLIGVFLAGAVLSGSQLRRQLRRLSGGVTNPQGAVTDSALIAAGTLLVFVPGLVSSAVGLALLAPGARAVIRPAATAYAARSFANRVVFADLNAGGYGATGHRGFGRGDYIDGEVIDGEVVDTERSGAPATGLPRTAIPPAQ